MFLLVGWDGFFGCGIDYRGDLGAMAGTRTSMAFTGDDMDMEVLWFGGEPGIYDYGCE